MSSKATVLVVDDDASVRDSLQRVLSRQGYVVDVTGTAEEALVLLAEKSFELVVTDLQMPGMDGLELLDEIKRYVPATPVIMITAYAATDVVIQALRRGVSDFVTKPYNLDDLLIIIEREVSRRRQAEEAGAPTAAAPADAGAPALLGQQLSPGQLDEIDRILAELRAEASARCVLLVESTGHVIDAKGVIEDINVSALAALVAGDFAATAGIASLIGEGDAFGLNYHEGQRYSVYSAHLAPDVFLLVVFGQEVKSGLVLYVTRQALPRLREIVDRAPAVPAAVPEAVSPMEMPAGETGPLYSLDELKASVLLDDDALAALDEQFKGLWK